MKRAKNRRPHLPNSEDCRISKELLEMAEGLHAHGVLSDETLAQIRASMSRDYRLRPLTREFLD